MPPESDRERADGQKATLAAVIWAFVLAMIFLSPALKDAVFGLMDAVLWPLVATLGYAGAVATIAGILGFGLVLAQKLMTDNARILAAKRRDGKASQRRVLRASLVPLGWALGPLMLVFLWFPERVDPAVWAAEPGRAVNAGGHVGSGVGEVRHLGSAGALGVGGGQRGHAIPATDPGDAGGFAPRVGYGERSLQGTVGTPRRRRADAAGVAGELGCVS